mmetsp:Transcript_31173/g.45646  ORF Transcript_31173/g.45646 Transcript_31173/m.45646 type:complete len:82 (-) Transcript_31173:555-800(-)
MQYSDYIESNLFYVVVRMVPCVISVALRVCKVSSLALQLTKLRLKHGIVVALFGRISFANVLIEESGKYEPGSVGQQQVCR